LKDIAKLGRTLVGPKVTEYNLLKNRKFNLTIRLVRKVVLLMVQVSCASLSHSDCAVCISNRCLCVSVFDFCV